MMPSLMSMWRVRRAVVPRARTEARMLSKASTVSWVMGK